MVKALGIDPGTASFDVCGIEDGEIFYENVLETPQLVEEPSLLIETVEEAMPVDLIAGPSGYGVEVTYLKNLDFENLREWYLTYILLLKRRDLEDALERGEKGIMVYQAMTETALEMKRRGWPVCYLPGVINLTTVPEHRKANKLDLGTVDKAVLGVLGVHNQAKRLDSDFSETSFIAVEMGAGYNGILGVEGGRIVDGIGGTTGGPAFLSIGGLDAELAQLVGNWEKADIFTGGGISITGQKSFEALRNNIETDENCKVAWEAIFEGIEKDVAAMLRSVSDPKEILISGRLTKMQMVRKELTDRLSGIAPVKTLESLGGTEITVKRGSQGYAMVAEGLAGGVYADLIEWMKIADAEGTALDHLYHPKGKQIKDELSTRVPFK